MKRKAYIKNQIRIICKTKARFLSIFVIVFLGASFFAGLRHAPMIMQNSMNSYIKEHHFNDLEYIATLGFSDEDIAGIKDIKAIDKMEVGFRFDALLQQGEQEKGVTVYAREDFSGAMNTSEIVEGRLPKQVDECIVDYQMKTRHGVSLGNTIMVKSAQGEKEFKIVGLVNDSRYISGLERGSNTLGDGTNSGFIEIFTKGNESLALPQTLYDLRNEEVLYNHVRITLKNTSKYNVFSEEYDHFVQEVNYKIKNILFDRYDTLYTSLTKDAIDNLQGYKEQYESGKTQYETKLASFNSSIAKAKIQLMEAKIEVTKNRKTLLETKQKMNEGMGALPIEIEKANQQLAALKNQLEELKQQDSSDSDNLPNTDLDNNALQDAIDNIVKEIGEIETRLDRVDSSLSSYAQLEQASLELEKATLEIQNNENELLLQEISTKQTFEKSKEDLDKAKTQIEEAEKQVNGIPKGNVISLTKNENASIVGFATNCESIEALSLLFPLIFFLVAALVSLTTMTRMVEEQRVQSGTFRALGYNKKDVIMQYLWYGFLATFIASILGMVFGVYFFPGIIYFLYCKMMYPIGAPIKVIFDTLICLQSFVISVAIILLVTFFVVYQEMKEMPSELLRPKAPKAGKRIVLERISFIWSRLSFNQKVTMRNIFRYKKRFFMSIIGIAGCTALIVIGFGIKWSVSSVVSNQYDNVWKYDGMLRYEQVHSLDDVEKLEKDVKKRQEISKLTSYYGKSIEVPADTKTYYANLEVPKDANEFENFISLQEFSSGDALHIGDEGVMISAKLAELLGVKEGGTFTIAIDGIEYDVKVNGVFETYIMHHIYMSKSHYEKLTGNSILYNGAYFTMKDETIPYQKSLEKYVNENVELSGISFVQGASESFDNQMKSIDSVVVILIVCAGALAFVVLYNLTNINIQERKSEIATIKVLGFYPREVYDYVFRENLLLAWIGAFIGLLLGKLVHMYLVRTVELEMTMFVRSLNFFSYFIAVVLTICFAMFINFIMRRVLKKIDMVESLKSIE